MKRVLFLFAVLFTAISAKAQIDTAYVNSVCIDQYMYPQLVDARLETCYREVPFLGGFDRANIYNFYFEEDGRIAKSNKIAQRYDLWGSLDIMGVAIATLELFCNEQNAHIRDTVRVGILENI